jgi:hypothetical protein
LSQALKHDEHAREEWAASSFAAEELATDRVHQALEQLVSSHGDQNTNDGRFMELISASRAIRHAWYLSGD